MPDKLTASPRVKLNGNEVDVSDFVSELRVHRSIGAAAYAQLRLDDTDEMAARFTVGGALAIEVVSDTGPVSTLFSGVVASVGLEFDWGRNELIVEAYDKSYQLAQRTDIKTHKNKSATDIIRQIAREAGLTSDISAELDKYKYAHVNQWGTVHRFLTELCTAAGCEWWVDEGKLIVRRRSAASAVAATTLRGGADLFRFSARFTSVEQTAKVRVRGWDVTTKSAVTAETSGINGGAPSKASVVTTQVPQANVATSWPRHVVAKGDAASVASGLAERMGNAVLSGRGETAINAAISPGTVVEIENVSVRWNGAYYVTSAEHLFGRGQPFVTRFTTGGGDDTLVDLLGRNDGPSSARFTGGLTIGIVTDNNDHEGELNRVKLRLPYLSDTDETDWARVVQPGAGAMRGLNCLPEINDEVLVGFEHGDIRRPYVIGGLWNGKDKPPMNSTNSLLLDGSKVVSRSFTSRKGHTITIVDGTQDSKDEISLKLKSPVVELFLGAEEIRLAHPGDFPMKVSTSRASFEIAKGGDITIKGNNIKLDALGDVTISSKQNVKIQGTANVEATANANLTMKGTAGVTVEASAITQLKGAIVKVN
jgi:phage protein D/phage baseplate assembly protein gpV